MADLPSARRQTAALARFFKDLTPFTITPNVFEANNPIAGQTSNPTTTQRSLTAHYQGPVRQCSKCEFARTGTDISPGATTVTELLARDRFSYYDALDGADAAANAGDPDGSEMVEFSKNLPKRQICPALERATSR
jgi:hypothetical protein